MAADPPVEDGAAAGGPRRDTERTDRAPGDKLRVDAAALEGNPFERRATWRAAFRASGTRAWAGAALMVAVLALAWKLHPPEAPPLREARDGTVRVVADDPHTVQQQIVSELRAAGVDAAGYEQLGITGIDANLPRPVPPQVSRALARHRIPVPANGVLQIEVVPARQVR